jgi:DNA-binding CsgD family transcriptional regulator
VWVLVRTALADRDEQARALMQGAPAGARAINAAALSYAEAIAAGRDGRSSDAERLFAQAEQLLPTQQWWRRLLRLLALESAVVDGWGRPVEELRSDLAVHADRGDHLLARSARDLLRRAGVGVRRGRGDAAVPPGLGAVGVTSREVDVLTLVAQGMTNAQIAARLFLSTRTVDHHVANLLAKTGATGRAELRGLVGG